MYQYLQSLQKFGINLGLERINYLLDKLGNPHQKFQSIHIAGTNGKGSTAAMIASILKEAGYKVGLYTSPHIFDYTERIKIRGKDITKKELATALGEVKKASFGMKSKPTIFEVLTAAAFLYFARKKVEIAVVEVGLGGRLDATNVITPLVNVITNIDYEHTEVLGKTLAKIAGEKAATIKPGVPVVTAERKPRVLKVIKKAVKNSDSLLVQVQGYDSANIPNLIGRHQKLNAACAVTAIRMAQIKVTRAQIRKGLKKAQWPGRFQIVSRKPLIIMDGAHNPAGSKVLRETIHKLYPKKKYTVIFGCQKTKDYKVMLKELKPITSKLILTKSSHPQAREFEGATGSIKQALKSWNKKSPLLITGSLFLVADGLNYLDNPVGGGGIISEQK